MEDRFIKYSKLYALIFLLFLSVPVLLGLLIVLFYGLSKVVASGVVDVIYGLTMITIAPAIFSAAYFIFFRRTAKHPVVTIRVISKFLFVVGILASAVVLTLDMITFFTQFQIDIAKYHCFSIAYLAGNVGGLFLIAIMQAFTTAKEVDWMDRHR